MTTAGLTSSGGTGNPSGSGRSYAPSTRDYCGHSKTNGVFVRTSTARPSIACVIPKHSDGLGVIVSAIIAIKVMTLADAPHGLIAYAAPEHAGSVAYPTVGSGPSDDGGHPCCRGIQKVPRMQEPQGSDIPPTPEFQVNVARQMETVYWPCPGCLPGRSLATMRVTLTIQMSVAITILLVDEPLVARGISS